MNTLPYLRATNNADQRNELRAAPQLEGHDALCLN